jgi:hypothetical protein
MVHGPCIRTRDLNEIKRGTPVKVFLFYYTYFLMSLESSINIVVSLPSATYHFSTLLMGCNSLFTIHHSLFSTNNVPMPVKYLPEYHPHVLIQQKYELSPE